MTDLNSSAANLPAAFYRNVELRPDFILYSQFFRSDSHDQSYSLVSRSYAEVARRIKRLASYLRECGLAAGDCAGIISATRPEWLEADLAIMSVGAVVVSLYPSLLEPEIRYILADSRIKLLFVENIEQYSKLQNILNSFEDRNDLQLKHIISFEKIAACESAIIFEDLVKNSNSVSLDSEPGSGWYDQLQPSSLASIVYTSGTTGQQKGVMQTHGNHLANIRQAREGCLYSPESGIFMLLPLAHSFSKLMGYIGFIGGVHLQFPSISDQNTSRANQRRTLLDLSQSTCSIIPLVPRILEKMKEGIEMQAARRNLMGLLLRLTLIGTSGVRKQKGILCKLIYFATSMIRRRIKNKLFGPGFRYVISGGAKLDTEVNHFFADLDVEILEGYGLTETCVATNCNRPGQNRIGSVGPVLARDIELKLSPEGEILFRGPNVTSGYLNKPEATAQSWDADGWFYSGDLGVISEDGYLTITGRKKEIIVTSGGKKISPERIENLLKSSELISQAMLVGEGRPYCIALITPNREKLKSIMHKYNAESVDQLLTNPEIRLELEEHLDRVNSGLASFETVKKVFLVKEDFSVENGFLTPTLKIRRNQIVKHYHAAIDTVFNGSAKVFIEGIIL